MTTKNFKGKKILILGGAYPHKKVVETAKKMELTTYVVDNLEKNKAPAKQIADYSYQIDIFEIDKVINLCREKHIDAVLSCNLDVCQKPYQIICERLKLPCFATSSQLDTLTNKNKFKKICKQYNLDTIQSFTIKEIKNKSFSDFPIFVKPAESSSSYGQTICHDHNEIEPALKFASKTSRNGKVIIEKYMRNNDDVGISGYMIDGHLYIWRMGDRFLGTGKMSNSEVLGIYPSRYYSLYKSNIHNKLEKMLLGIGLYNAPVFFQGFIDKDTIRLYDTAIRMPGTDCEKAYEKIYDINLSEMCIYFALTSRFPTSFSTIKNNNPSKTSTLLMFFPIMPGKLNNIIGYELLKNQPETVAFQTQYTIGDIIPEEYNAKQRLGELDMVFDDVKSLKEKINWIYENFSVLDTKNQEMLFSKFDSSRLNVYFN